MNRLARVYATLATAALALSGRAASPLSALAQDASVLAVGSTIERQLARGEAHRYLSTLSAHEHASAIVEQQGIDTVGQVRGTDDAVIANYQDEIRRRGREHKDYAKAVDYYTRALSVRERVLGSDHPDIATLLNDLANVYRQMGDYRRALATQFRALETWEKSVGPYHPGTLSSVGNIARTYASMGEIPQAIEFQRRADAILEKQLALNVAGGSERQKLAFARSVSERTDRTISLHLDQALYDPDASSLAALVLLQRKGRVQDAMTDVFATVRQHVPTPEDRAVLDRLTETSAQLAQLALNAPLNVPREERRQAIARLEARKEQLEALLSERCAEFRAQMQPVTLQAVQAALPADAALLEFAVFRPFDPRAARNAEAYGPPHYAAYVIHKTGTPFGVDLGEAKAIDRRIEMLREGLRDPARLDVRAHARVVDELVMRPLRPSLGNAIRLLVSPDGALNLLAFEALVDDHGRYLIERHAMSYLTSGRDLLRMQGVSMDSTPPVILADPLFGESATTRLASARSARPSVTTGVNMSTVYFAPLAATAEEARAIKALFPESTLLTGRHATKAALHRVEAPRILHIASHGFFVKDASRTATPAPVTSVEGARGMAATINAKNPLLRSGLALAGANLTRDAHDDGILTALEASSLNLLGTKLVTLSACDTGIGEVRNGEGVYGLRRAFVLAGTETLVMSLWPISDAAARETMVAYYTGLRAGLGRGDALRQAKLALLRRKARRHPFFWASFIQSGEWASLDGTR